MIKISNKLRLSIIFIFVVAIISGCSANSKIAESISQNNEESFISTSEENAYSENEANNLSIDILKLNDNYRTSLNSNGGYEYFLKDDNYYSLGQYISKEKSNEYQVGWNRNDVNFQYPIYLTFGEFIKAVGPIPVPEYGPQDTVIGINHTTLGLNEAQIAGYSIRIYSIDDPQYYLRLIPSPNEIIDINLKNVKQFQMTDSNGNNIQQVIGYSEYGVDYYCPDFYNLKQGEKYTVSWFEGTTYNEYEMIADSPYYDVNWVKPGTNNCKYNIEGELHKEGYAVFDLSDIPSGVYRTDMGGFICIAD